jgi:hypothetical protein
MLCIAQGRARQGSIKIDFKKKNQKNLTVAGGFRKKA